MLAEDYHWPHTFINWALNNRSKLNSINIENYSSFGCWVIEKIPNECIKNKHVTK
jgi:hypothetical protein